MNPYKETEVINDASSWVRLLIATEHGHVILVANKTHGHFYQHPTKRCYQVENFQRTLKNINANIANKIKSLDVEKAIKDGVSTPTFKSSLSFQLSLE